MRNVKARSIVGPAAVALIAFGVAIVAIARATDSGTSTPTADSSPPSGATPVVTVSNAPVVLGQLRLLPPGSVPRQAKLGVDVGKIITRKGSSVNDAGFVASGAGLLSGTATPPDGYLLSEVGGYESQGSDGHTEVYYTVMTYSSQNGSFDIERKLIGPGETLDVVLASSDEAYLRQSTGDINGTPALFLHSAPGKPAGYSEVIFVRGNVATSVRSNGSLTIDELIRAAEGLSS
jgi:hypothetical protein